MAAADSSSPWVRERSRREAAVRLDAQAALQARRELGPDYDEQIALQLVETVREIVQREAEEEKPERQAVESVQEQRFWLALGSLGAGIPITGIGATQIDPGLLGAALGWVGIVAVNVVFALGSRRRRK